MAINLGEAPEQKEPGGGGPIPQGSMVKVRMEIRQPKQQDPQDPCVTVFKTGLKGLDCQFTVVSGQFESVKIWENWFLSPQMQTISLSKGQEGMCNAGFAKCRAVIEAARRIDPNDPNGNRNIESWYDLNGLEFPAKIGVDKPKPGDIYINNNIAKVLTVADEEFEKVMGGGEIVTDTPFPELPNAPDAPKGQAKQPAQAAGGGGNGQKTTPQPPWMNKKQ